ncbi:MAG: aldo/keto reductase [Gammaproteobacteria bacterium]|nr:aldo/keto reductase [Gammaproteobacteria bacterium]
MIERIEFGGTGHHSTRTIFGAAGLGRMKQDRADQVLDILLEFGVNHIDTAAGYGDSELRIAPWLQRHPDTFFLATKTGERTYAGAREGLARSLDRLGVDHVDLIQLHNLAETHEQEVALGPGGALEALVEARDAGLTRFIGVTGHGTYIAARHIESLGKFPFDSVLLPYSHSMMAQAGYATDFDALYALCRERRVAIQTIKSVAHRRWKESDTEPRHSWYRPIRDEDALRHAVQFVLARDGLFLNTSSDATLLRRILEVASEQQASPTDSELSHDTERLGIEPLFVRDVSDRI